MPEEAAAEFVAEDLFADEVGGAFVEGGVTAASGEGALSAAEMAASSEVAANAMPGAISVGGALADTAGMPAAFAGGAAVEAASSVPGAIKAATTPSSFGTGLNALKTAATILAPVASIAGAASGVAASRAIPRSGSVLNTPAPLVTPPVTMPTFGSGTSLTNPFSTPVVQRSAIQQQTQRRGRAATILTDPADSERLGA